MIVTPLMQLHEKKTEKASKVITSCYSCNIDMNKDEKVVRKAQMYSSEDRTIFMDKTLLRRQFVVS